MFSSYLFLFVIVSVISAVSANSGVSLCDKYTTALLKDNTAENQMTLLILVVNTAVIGNYTAPNVGIIVPGILANGSFNGEDVNLLPFFSGELETSNVNDIPSKVNFLDGGGAKPIQMNMPAADTTSNQYFLLVHLYQLFGSLLGCSMQNSSSVFKPYSGDISMYTVHKFMKLNAAQVGYFIHQVGLSAASFGVSKEDVTTIGTALTTLFNQKCTKAVPLTPQSQPEAQSVCTADDCTLKDGVCPSPLTPNTTTNNPDSSPVSSPVSTPQSNSANKNFGLGLLALLALLVLILATL